MKINLSTALTILGGLGVLAPDLTGLAAWLTSLHVGWLTHVAHGLGGAALLCASLPRVIEKLRPVLASLDLATPPSAASVGDVSAKALPLADAARDPQKGGTVASCAILLGILALLAACVFSLACPRQARADSNSPTGGGCAAYELDGKTCKLSFQPAAIIPIFAFNLQTGSVQGGVSSLGACYGFTYKPTQWYASGIDYCLTARFGSATPDSISPLTLMAHIADYGSFGGGPVGEQTTSGMAWQWWLFFAPRLPIQ
jgi:hypothetical protein